MYKKLSEVDKLELQIIAEAIAPPRHTAMSGGAQFVDGWTSCQRRSNP